VASYTSQKLLKGVISINFSEGCKPTLLLLADYPFDRCPKRPRPEIIAEDAIEAMFARARSFQPYSVDRDTPCSFSPSVCLPRSLDSGLAPPAGSTSQCFRSCCRCRNRPVEAQGLQRLPPDDYLKEDV
jgi:hypothetical protein